MTSPNIGSSAFTDGVADAGDEDGHSLTLITLQYDLMSIGHIQDPACECVGLEFRG